MTSEKSVQRLKTLETVTPIDKSHAAPAGLRNQFHNSAPRPFHRVRKTDNTSIARKIVSNP